LLLLLLEDARQPEQPEDQGNHYEEQRPAEKENGPRLRSMQRFVTKVNVAFKLLSFNVVIEISVRL